jgi:hypothetical protein
MPGVFGSTERSMVIGPFIPQKKLLTNGWFGKYVAAESPCSGVSR